MPDSIKISRALLSVYNKDKLEKIVPLLGKSGVQFVSTGGTATFIEKLGFAVTPVEELTGFPSVFGGRVKTLHPSVFGGILFRRELAADEEEARRFHIPAIDLVLVDLYPFEETLAGGAPEEEIIEKIDIGGVALIRAAAKNFNDVLVVSSRTQYDELIRLLQERGGTTTLADRRQFASAAFAITSNYDTAIANYFHKDDGLVAFRKAVTGGRVLRYGENPHQSGVFYGRLEDLVEQLHGKELSYNNLVDIHAALAQLQEFEGRTTFVIIKHTNACGTASDPVVREAYLKALKADPVSAFGGVLAVNAPIDKESAEEINNLFFEILIAPAFDEAALAILRSKKNRILLRQARSLERGQQFKSLLNGVIAQDADFVSDAAADFRVVTRRAPTGEELKAMEYAARIVKHAKSNAIVLAVDGQLLASGVGQTSRVDALRQAIAKALSFGFSLQGSTMASDAFFPFPDCVEIADQQGIRSVIQPGGSVRDKDSIDYCDAHGMAMVFTGKRHFLH